MLGVVVAAAAAALPPALPPQGLVTRAARGVVLVDLRGRMLGRLDAFRLDDVAEPARRPREVLLRRGRAEYVLGPNGVRRVALLRGGWPRTPTGCHPGPAPFTICGYPWSLRARPSTVYLRGRKLLSRSRGYWRSVELSPDRRRLLLQWSGECEIPTAYLARADGRGLRAAAAESVALGWTPSGRAVLDLPRGACGASFRRPGIYLLDPRSRRASFVYRGHGRLWGSAFSSRPAR
jgi:hypothetical protein